MKVGDVVKGVQSGKYGTVHESSFGVSVHVWDESMKTLGKTLGESVEVVSKYWKVTRMPKGHRRHPHGGIEKIEG